MRFARLTATLALIALFSALVIVLNHNTSTGTTTATTAAPLNVNLYKAFNWQREWRAAEARRLQTEAAAAAKAAAEKAAIDQAIAERAVATRKTARIRSTPRRIVQGSNNGDFASCVREKESSNNYAYNGYYKGAYNMTTDHWSGYGGYSNPADAPPGVQDAKFQSDVAQGSGYMHQQYPTTSRACGM